MKKKLVFYWYIPPFNWHKIYDLHLKSLDLFKDVFDEKLFVLSHDSGLDEKFIEETKTKLLEHVPDAKFVEYENDKQLREAKYFKHEIVLKLGEFPKDEAIFFAHNKGVSSNYVSPRDLIWWINGMYYCCLARQDLLDGYLEDNDVCAVGSFLIRGHDPFVIPYGFKLKYKWHYSGTFFWLVPSRLNDYIIKNNVEIPKDNRYFAEGFLGNVFPDDEKNWKVIFAEQKAIDKKSAYIQKTFSEEDLNKFKEIYGND